MRGIISHCGSKLSLLVKASQFSVSLGCCQSYRPFSVYGWGAFSSFPSQHSPCTSQPILYHPSFHRVTALIKPCTQGPPQHLFFYSFFSFLGCYMALGPPLASTVMCPPHNSPIIPTFTDTAPTLQTTPPVWPCLSLSLSYMTYTFLIDIPRNQYNDTLSSLPHIHASITCMLS